MKNDTKIVNNIDRIKPILNILSTDVKNIIFENVRVFKDNQVAMFVLVISYYQYVQHSDLIYDKQSIKEYIIKKNIQNIYVTLDSDEKKPYIQIIISV